jgi:hypothetical protein
MGSRSPVQVPCFLSTASMVVSRFFRRLRRLASLPNTAGIASCSSAAMRASTWAMVALHCTALHPGQPGALDQVIELPDGGGPGHQPEILLVKG